MNVCCPKLTLEVVWVCTRAASDGSRHLARGANHVADPDIRIQTFGCGQFNVSQYLTFISSLEGAKAVAKLDEGTMAKFAPCVQRHFLSLCRCGLVLMGIFMGSLGSKLPEVNPFLLYKPKNA